jgi:hypothetical protein
MKRIQVFSAVALMGALGCARADDLVIRMNGMQTYYSGTISHFETDGMLGEVIIFAGWPESISEDDFPAPTQIGDWHIVVHGYDGTVVDTVMTCSGATANTFDHGSRVDLNCVEAFRASPHWR